MRATIITSVLALGLLGFVPASNAAVINDTSLAAPGVYYGTGNEGTNAHWTVDSETNLELGVQALIRFTGPVTPTGNVYDVPLGNTTASGHQGSAWGFAFSVHATTATVLSGLTYSMSIYDYYNDSTTTFNPKGIP